jgi:hypothetical protein
MHKYNMSANTNKSNCGCKNKDDSKTNYTQKQQAILDSIKKVTQTKKAKYKLFI